MCTHEIWTYSECGCQYDHHISCFESLADSDDDYELSRTSVRNDKYPSSRALDNSSPVKLPPSPSAPDSGDEAHLRCGRQTLQRSCSVNRTVSRKFLEPICDDCLLAELGVSASNTNIHGRTVMGHDGGGGENMIWESDVKIEVREHAASISESSPRNSDLVQRGSVGCNAEVVITTATRPRSAIFPVVSQQTDPSSAPSRLSTGDADSESSAPSVSPRGRPRSRTKQLRRMAMDVSREDLRLRISSRLPSFQRDSLQSFREQLQRGGSKKTPGDPRPDSPAYVAEPVKRGTPQPLRSFMQRLTDARDDKWFKAKDAVQDLGRKLSRKSPSPRRATRMRNALPVGHQGGLVATTWARITEEAIGTNADDCYTASPVRPATGGSIDPDSFYLPPNDPFHPAVELPADSPVHVHQIPTRPLAETWHSHLQHDLTTPRTRKHRPALQLPGTQSMSNLLDGKAKPHVDIPDRGRASGSTSTTAVSMSATSHNWQCFPSVGSNPFSHKSYEYSAPTSDEVEVRRRLLAVSVAPSVPATASSASYRSYHSRSVRGDRLASIVSNGDFDDLDSSSTYHVGVPSIEQEMAMVGLTENPWRGPSLNTDEAYDAALARNNESRLQSNASVDLRVASEENDPFTDARPSTPPVAVSSAGMSPPTTIRAPLPGTRITQDLSTLSGMHGTSFIGCLASTSPVSVASLNASPLLQGPLDCSHRHPHTQLAFHALSTPFHHSLAPNYHHSQQQAGNGSPRTIATVLHSALTPTRPQSAPQTSSFAALSAQPLPESQLQTQHVHATIAHIPRNTTPPTVPPDFSLSGSPAGLFSCVWERSTCAGLGESEARKESTQTTQEVAKAKCGGVTGWRVRSCLCSGTVRRSSSSKIDSAGDGLEAECRSAAPVVRYVRGEDMCMRCQSLGVNERE